MFLLGLKRPAVTANDATVIIAFLEAGDEPQSSLLVGEAPKPQLIQDGVAKRSPWPGDEPLDLGSQQPVPSHG